MLKLTRRVAECRSLRKNLPLHERRVEAAAGQQATATLREAYVADHQVAAVGVTVELAGEKKGHSASGYIGGTV